MPYCESQACLGFILSSVNTEILFDGIAPPVAHSRLHLLVDNLVDDRNGLLVGNDSLEVIFQAFDVVLILTSAELRRLSAMMIPPAVLYTLFVSD